MPSLPDCDMTQQFYHERKFVASGRAKNLRCCECRRAIEKGETYYRCTGKWDRDLWSGSQHLHCWLFARSINGHDSTSWSSSCWGEPAHLRRGAGLNAWGFEFGGCVPFEGLHEELGEIQHWGDFDKLTHDPIRFWDSMISGCSEKFFDGSGI